MNSWGTSKTTSPQIDFPLLAPMQVMKQRIRGLELQISNGVKMERGMWRGAAHGWKRGEVGGKTVKREKILTVLHRGEGKWQLPGWTGQTGLTDRSDRSHPMCQKLCCADYPGEYPEYPGIAQSIRENIQRIRDIDHKEVLVWKFLDQMVKHFQEFKFSDLMC